jgi:RNA polymerase sigma-70 factor (ECF subfamily)
MDAGTSLATRGDDELMALARAGLAGAFDVLVRRHQTRALRVAARHLGASALAPDAVQNAFLDVFRSLDTYEARGRFVSYFYRVLLNQCRMVRRARRTREPVFASGGLQEPLGEAQILARERERELRQALGQLSEKLRQVVLLRYSAELSYEEVAEALRIPMGTVKRRLFDAMVKLRELLGER